MTDVSAYRCSASDLHALIEQALARYFEARFAGLAADPLYDAAAGAIRPGGGKAGRATGGDAGAFGTKQLLEAMRYSLSTPGKRLRPMLLLAAGEAFGAQRASLMPFAMAMEMIHAYSLIHDDLPAMDDDDLRRGRPSNHIVYGEGMAILAGDALLTEAFSSMAAAPVAAKLSLRVNAEIARAAGIGGMVGGQAADLLAEGKEPSPEILLSIHARKTGALIRASVRAGAILAAVEEPVLAELTAFAEGYGLAFQIADDIKDEVAPIELSGKRGGGDRAAGKLTYPAVFGIEASRERCRLELEAALGRLVPFEARTGLLEHVARDSVAPAFL